MSAPLPPEVTVTELPTGVHYRLPPRPLGTYRYVGLALFILGLVLCSVPLIPAWQVVRAIRQEIPDDQGMLWLFAAAFCFLFLRAGLALAHVGLFILAGHSEIELRGGTLYAVERCGPVRWTWERSAVGLRRFFVSEGLEPLNAFGKVSVGPLGTLGVITPEWKAVVGGEKAKPMWLAPGYPRPRLLALAEDLARRCPLPAAAPAAGQPAPTVPVLEKEPDFSDYEELAEQPAGSQITVEETATGLTLNVPPVGLGPNAGAILCGGLFVCLVAAGISANVSADDEVISTVLVAAGVWVAGIALLVEGASRVGRRAELVVVGDTLFVRQSNLFGSEWQQWSRQHVADVFVVHCPGDSDNDDYWQLQIQPHPGGGDAYHLLAGRDVAELRWLATVLRRALRCPCNSQDSPPPGLVVRSPLLVLRSRGWGP
jgi:hypothetical protein